jgi:hypothetical protein
MAWKRAIAADYKDLILQIRNFCLKSTDTGVLVVGGSNVGDGLLYGPSSTESSVVEDFTITCISGGSVEVTGNPLPDITGTYLQTGANDGKPTYQDATYALWWDTSTEYWYNTIIANIGSVPTDGFRLNAGSPEGTWEAIGTATGVPVSAGDVSPTFSVTGSVSGAQAVATLLEPYSNGILSFTILNGAIPFAVSDTFTIPVEVSTALWSEERYDVTTNPDTPETILKGIGGGTDEVFIGMKAVTNSSTYWNLSVNGLTGYVDSNAFEAQPGYSASPYVLLSSSSFVFWVFMTSRSIRIVANIGSIDEHACMGWMLPNQLPSQYNYPMLQAGSSSGSTTVLSDTGGNHTAWWSGLTSNSEAKFLDGSTWRTINTNDHYPENYGSFSEYGVNRLGKYPVYPVTLGDFSQDKVYGEVEGVFYVPNQSGVLVTGDVLSSITEGYIIFQDTFRTGKRNVIAYDLM